MRRNVKHEDNNSILSLHLSGCMRLDLRKSGFHTQLASYKHLQIPILIIWSIITREVDTDACMKIATIL